MKQYIYIFIYELSLDCLKLFTCKQERKKQTKIGHLQLHYLKYFTIPIFRNFFRQISVISPLKNSQSVR